MKDVFTGNKSKEANPFKCECCDKDKKSKTTVLWEVDNVTKTICNGCYGQMLRELKKES